MKQIKSDPEHIPDPIFMMAFGERASIYVYLSVLDYSAFFSLRKIVLIDDLSFFGLHANWNFFTRDPM